MLTPAALAARAYMFSRRCNDWERTKDVSEARRERFMKSSSERDHCSPEGGPRLLIYCFFPSSSLARSPRYTSPMPGKRKFEEQLAALDSLKQQAPEARV